MYYKPTIIHRNVNISREIGRLYIKRDLDLYLNTRFLEGLIRIGFYKDLSEGTDFCS